MLPSKLPSKRRLSRLHGHQQAGSAQAAAQRWVGAPCTAFQRVTEGQKSVRKGDVVLLSGKPAVLGAVLAFTVAQVRPGVSGWLLSLSSSTISVLLAGRAVQ